MKLSARMYWLGAFAIAMTGLTGCDDTESFSDMLRDEEHACNWYLSQKRVETELPADLKFEVGEDAPFYRLDEDGYVYMQVINEGDKDIMPEDGDRVYFRYMRRNIKYLYAGQDVTAEGNADNLNSSLGSTSFVLGNTVLDNTTRWGTGIQMPLEYLGYNSEVNLVLKSYYGFTQDQGQCLPYIINIRYFKAEY